MPAVKTTIASDATSVRSFMRYSFHARSSDPSGALAYHLPCRRGCPGSYFPVWGASREDFSSPSIERCAILRDSRTWRLYISYVDGVDGRWRIDVIEAGSPDSFDPAARRLALDADMANAVAVKDPWVRRVGDR